MPPAARFQARQQKPSGTRLPTLARSLWGLTALWAPMPCALTLKNSQPRQKPTLARTRMLASLTSLVSTIRHRKKWLRLLKDLPATDSLILLAAAAVRGLPISKPWPKPLPSTLPARFLSVQKHFAYQALNLSQVTKTLFSSTLVSAPTLPAPSASCA